jgi:3-hydroxyisobutyrate dehydrogenase
MYLLSYCLLNIFLVSRLGLEPKLLAKIINSSSGRCWSSEVYNPCPGVVMGIPSANNYQGGFGSELMAKVCIIC